MIVFTVIYFVAMVLILFGVTIFVHELGHFVVARKLGMQADVFSIGFGHPIWKKEKDGVLYKIGWIPFGGYVALPQMEPGGGYTVDDDGNKHSLPRVAAWKKIAVALAGAVGNIIFAFVIAIVVFWQGKPATLQESENLVGFVATNSVAYAEGIRVGDRVVQVRALRGSSEKEPGVMGKVLGRLSGEADGPVWRDTPSWQALMIEASLAQDGIELRVEKPAGETEVVSLATEEGAIGIKGVYGLGGIDGMDIALVGGLVEESSALAAGVLPGDIISFFDGERVFSTRQLSALVTERRAQTVPMTVDREGEEVVLNVTPKWDEDAQRALIGVRFSPFAVDSGKLVHPTPIFQIKEHASLILRTLRALVSPREAGTAVKQIGGPPMIFAYLWFMLHAGFMMALSFTCLLNVNLAIINLLPFPVLDGGHIVFALIEMVARRPLHERIVSGLTTVFAVLLLSAMLFLSYRDVDRMLDSRKGRSAPEKPAAEAPVADPDLVPATAP